MPQYFALVEKDTGSAYGVRFPDVPGCFSAADKLDDVVSNAIEALSLFAEDEALPRPRNLESIRELADIKEALAEGAFLVAVPMIENDARVVRANITMEQGLLQAIDEAAKARKLTRSAFLAQAARHEING